MDISEALSTLEATEKVTTLGQQPSTSINQGEVEKCECKTLEGYPNEMKYAMQTVKNTGTSSVIMDFAHLKVSAT